jgi:hypothetical protein
MPILEDLKEYTERATGLKRPGKQEAPNLARRRKPHAARFRTTVSSPINRDGR